MEKHALAVGVDLGGTKVEVAVLPRRALVQTPALSAEALEAQVQVRRRLPTDASHGYDAVLARVAGLVRAALVEAGDLHGGVTVGLGLPGQVSRVTSRLKNSNTLCLNGRDVRADLSRLLQLDVHTDNDANLFALAEATWGAGRGAEVVFGVILGTGVGGGVVVRGAPLSGLQGIAGEWGHNPLERGGLPCYCGRAGCVETYLSGPGLSAALAEAGHAMSARAFDEGWRAGAFAGVPAVQAVAAAYLTRFGSALGAVVNILDPDVVVLGGGMGKWPALYEQGRAALRAEVFNDELLTRLEPPQLGDSAGVYGAALLGVQRAG